jgi:hypothetical protein
MRAKSHRFDAQGHLRGLTNIAEWITKYIVFGGVEVSSVFDSRQIISFVSTDAYDMLLIVWSVTSGADEIGASWMGPAGYFAYSSRR